MIGLSKEIAIKKAVELANCIRELEEYKDFVKSEENLERDEIAQKMLAEFRKIHQDFLMMQMSGEFDSKLLSDLTELQTKLNSRESVVRFVESYNKLINIIEEILDVISENINIDLSEVYKQ